MESIVKTTPDIISLYDEHRAHLDALREDNKELVQPLKHNHRSISFKKKIQKVKGLQTVVVEWDEYIGLRPAGGFFSYHAPNVWVKLANSHVTEYTYNMRHINKGFYITITTIDDSALYADWAEPLTPEQLEQVIQYFDVMAIDGLDSDSGTLSDIESLIGKCKYVDFS